MARSKVYREDLPIRIDGRDEKPLHADDFLRIPVTVAVLRKVGKSIGGALGP